MTNVREVNLRHSSIEIGVSGYAIESFLRKNWFLKFSANQKNFAQFRKTIETKRKEIEEKEKKLVEFDRQLQKRKEQMDQLEKSLQKVKYLTKLIRDLNLSVKNSYFY